MAENPSKKSHSFFSFWGNAIKNGWSESREKFGLVVDITLAISVAVLLGAAWYSKHHPQFDADKENAANRPVMAVNVLRDAGSVNINVKQSIPCIRAPKQLNQAPGKSPRYTRN
jgi:hypothetical protein